jgi:hypothetical protein
VTTTVSRSDLHPPSLFCVEIRTPRWAELVDWYRGALGLRVLMRGVDDGYALLAAGETRIAIIARPAPTAHAEGFRELSLTDPDGNRLRLFAWPAPAGR